MGVPGFVAWLRKYFKDRMISSSLPSRPKKGYIDGNCLLHPKCFEILENCKDVRDREKLEMLMFKRIVNFIDYLVDYIGPTDEFYFAIDGVAPISKINQQRKRRYRSIDDTKMKEELKRNYSLGSGTQWSNTVITPGTEFMERLHQHLLKYFSNKARGSRGRIKYTYSSYHTPGEGEHKILQDIRRCIADGAKDDDIYVIYGLDADLFFLAMASQKKNIYLLREEFHFVNGKPVKHELYDPVEDVAEEMRFVSIDVTKHCYYLRMEEVLQQKREQAGAPARAGQGAVERDGVNEACNDFIFICYLLGNDFLPHLPSIDIHTGGLDTVIDSYTELLIRLGSRLLTVDAKNRVTINTIFLQTLLKNLGDREEQYFTEVLPAHHHQKQKRRPPPGDEYSREVWRIENMRFRVEDSIRLGVGERSEWKFRYYEHYFRVSEHYGEHVRLMCQKYLEGLMWVTHYYYTECPSWRWQYPFTHAPFLSDIVDYLVESKLDVNEIPFERSTPLTPCVQLLSVLPPSCQDLIPKNYRPLVTDRRSPIVDMFPTTVMLDMINKDMYWMCVPMLPHLNVDRILATVKDVKLSPEEAIRNREEGPSVFGGDGAGNGTGNGAGSRAKGRAPKAK